MQKNCIRSYVTVAQNDSAYGRIFICAPTGNAQMQHILPWFIEIKSRSSEYRKVRVISPNAITTIKFRNVQYIERGELCGGLWLNYIYNNYFYTRQKIEFIEFQDFIALRREKKANIFLSRKTLTLLGFALPCLLFNANVDFRNPFCLILFTHSRIYLLHDKCANANCSGAFECIVLSHKNGHKTENYTK